jgi:hypothetical protein
VNEVARPWYRAIAWVAAAVVLLSSLAAILGTASAAATTYTLTGYVDQPTGLSGPPVPAGVTVDLISRATGQVYTTTTTTGGQFTFTSGSTSGALAPGYWGLSVPAVGNVSLTGCRPCAVLPENQTPVWSFYNSTFLTTASYSTVLTNVAIHLYNATLNGTVKQNSGVVQGAVVHLLDPEYSGLVLANNTTNATGYFTLKVPYGTWVLSITHASGATIYSNSTLLTVTTPYPGPKTFNLQSFVLSGRIQTGTGYVPTPGNATLFDPTNHYIYTVATPPGGFYSFPTYLANFVTGTQTFDVVLSSAGYETAWFTQAVSNNTPITKSVTVSAVPGSALGQIDTKLNFSGINVATGAGSLAVTTNASLGNESAIPGLPNATVGQLWAQLGLDFNHSLSLPAATVSGAFKGWVTNTGPFFPAVQAGTTFNGTKFVAPASPQSPAAFATTCTTGYCGLSTGGTVTYSWSTTYALNGTIPKNASTYSISFGFEHPTVSSELYNYTVVLPAGYALSAGTTAPTHTALLGSGPSGTWTTFTLESKPYTTASSTATFSIVKVAGLTARVNITVANSTFSSANVLSSTNSNYTVVVGVGQNVTFSAANSTYVHGANGTTFTWNFGDGSPPKTVTNATTYHTFAAASGLKPYKPYNGTLNITSSGGKKNQTTFHVIVVSNSPGPKAVISDNASAAEIKTAGANTYLEVNWSTTLHFNASKSNTSSPNVGSIASYHLHAKGFNQSANFSVASGAKFAANWSVEFNGAGAYLSQGNVNGTMIPFTGWQYNLTLTIWTGTGGTSTAYLVILVVDTQKPISAFSVLSSSGTPISGSGITEGPSGTATILLNAQNSSDPNNGSVTNYYWKITNGNNTSLAHYLNTTLVKPSGAYPSFTLVPEQTAYLINLTVTDANHNKASTNKSLTVSVNSTTRPILQAASLTLPATLTEGKGVTVWVNVTVGGGSKSTADNLSVVFFLGSSAGLTGRKVIAGSPDSVRFYTYLSNGTVNSSLYGTGVLKSVPYGKTLRAEISWTPTVTGNFQLYANATASNEYGPNEINNAVSVPIAVHPSSTTELIEYGGIGAAVIVVIAGLVWWYRRPRRPTVAKPTASRSGLERGPKSSSSDDDA